MKNNREVTFKQIEDALKKMYGENAGVDIVEPIIYIPDKDTIEDVQSFNDNIALILYPNKPEYDPKQDSMDLVKAAREIGAIVIPIPAQQCNFLTAKSTRRNFKRVCTKYGDIQFIIPQTDIPSIYNETLPVDTLIKGGAQKVVKQINGKSM